MKTKNKKPTVKNGWLLASKKVLYGNSPMIRVSSINVLNYFEDVKNNTYKTPNGLYDRDIPNEWYITFGDDRKWYYKNNKILLEDYNIIASLLFEDEKISSDLKELQSKKDYI